MHDELFNYGPCISRLEKPKCPKNKDVTAINICNGRTDSFVAKHLRSKKCHPCSGSDEAVKRKMFGSMKTARRQNWPRQGSVIFHWELGSDGGKKDTGSVLTIQKNIINVSESLLVHEIPVSTLRSGKVVRLMPVISLVMSLLPNDNIEQQKNKETFHLPETESWLFSSRSW